MNIYDEMKKAGVEIGHHESDLYVPVNEATREIISRYQHRENVKPFTHKVYGVPWFDIPFAYSPFGKRGDEINP